MNQQTQLERFAHVSYGFACLSPNGIRRERLFTFAAREFRFLDNVSARGDSALVIRRRRKQSLASVRDFLMPTRVPADCCRHLHSLIPIHRSLINFYQLSLKNVAVCTAPSDSLDNAYKARIVRIKYRSSLNRPSREAIELSWGSIHQLL